MNNNDCYTNILKKEYLKRCERNPAYSLRAFARDIDLSSGRLSDILNRRANLSVKKAKDICSLLKFSSIEEELFVARVILETSKNQDRINQAIDKIRELSYEQKVITLDQNTSEMISSWYYFAILEATNLRNFKSCPTWIAQLLNLEKDLVEKAIERLIKYGLLKYENNTLKCVKNVTSRQSPSRQSRLEGLKAYHKELLNLISSELENSLSDSRDFSSMTVSLNSESLAIIKSKIKKFRRSFGSFCDNDEKKDSIYSLGIYLVPLGGDKVEKEC